MIGLFDSRVTYKPLTKSATGTGGNTASYASNNLTRWTFVEDINQSRVTDNGTLVMANEKRFKVRWDSSLEAIMDKTTILTYDSQNYTIKDFRLNTEKGGDVYEIIGIYNG